MLDQKLQMNTAAGEIVETFKPDLFIIWSEGRAEKLIIRYCALGGGDGGSADNGGHFLTPTREHDAQRRRRGVTKCQGYSTGLYRRKRTTGKRK